MKIIVDPKNFNFYGIGAALYQTLYDILTPKEGSVADFLVRLLPGWGPAQQWAKSQAAKYRSLAAKTGYTNPGLGDRKGARSGATPPPQSVTPPPRHTVPQTSLGQASVPQVNVYIGDEPITEMIQTELVLQDASNTSHIVRGRRV